MKPMWRLAMVVGFAALALAGCGGGVPPAKVQAWVGRSATDLIHDWGTPTKEVEDAGQRVLVFDELESSHTADFKKDVSTRNQPMQQLSTVGSTSYARSYLFWVDGAGKITRTEIRQR